MFLTVHKFKEMTKSFESPFNLISLSKFSTPTDKSGEPQNDILDDELLLLSSLSSFVLGLPLLGVRRVANLDFSDDDDDLIILGALDSLELTDPLDVCLRSLSLFFNLDDFLGACLVSLGSWETSLDGEFVLILIDVLCLRQKLNKCRMMFST